MKDPNSENCEKVYAVSRKVVKTEAVEELHYSNFKGTTSTEEEKGIFHLFLLVL